MKKVHASVKIFLLLMLFACAPCSAEEAIVYRSAELSYSIYGGSLGEPMAANSGDKKIAFSLKGRAARDVFGAIGPDRADACASDATTRVRWRDDQKLVCIRRGGEDYWCYFGFDLISGKSIGGSIC